MLGGRISKDFVERIRDAGDIVRIVSEYVPLKPAGTRFKGLCPFHQEKTPSFSVDPDRKLFYCFGCQTGGDLFKFVSLYENVSFPEAVESLARRLGVPLPEDPVHERKVEPRDRVLAIHGAAEAFFRERLRDEGGAPCRAYLERRGLGAETVDRLGLGYAPDAWEALRTHLLAKRFRPEELVTGGVALERKSGSGQYDRFRNRLIFPIRDVNGATVAFGGRALDETEPKYLNSPETPAYVKGNHLYGLDRARDAIRREGFAIVVEGYLDLAAVVQAGFGNVVASLGTAFTPAQARLLSRFTRRVVVSYDGDAAGSAATLRSLDLLLEHGFEVRVAELPQGLDPDDVIRRDGAEAYVRSVRQAPGYLDYVVRREAASRDLTRPDGKAAAVAAALPHLVRLPNAIERAEWAGRLADAFRIDDELVLQELRRALRRASDGMPRVLEARPAPGADRPVEHLLVRLLLQYPECRDVVRAELDARDLETAAVRDVVHTILRRSEDDSPVDYLAILDDLPRDEDRDLLTRIAFREEPLPPAEAAADCLRTLRRERLERERREVQRQMTKAVDPTTVDTLSVRALDLARQINALS